MQSEVAHYLVNLVRDDVDQFAMNLQTARVMWREHRRLVEAEDILVSADLASVVQTIVEDNVPLAIEYASREVPAA